MATEWALLTLEKVPPETCKLRLTKVDDINDGNCVGPGDEINYTICYSYLGDANCCLDINDVNLIDELSPEVEPNNLFDPNYNPYDNTYTWHIGTLKPGDVNCVTLKVNVKECVVPGSTITNECKLIRDGNEVLVSAEENTPVYCNCIIVDDMDDYGDNAETPGEPGGCIYYVWRDGWDVSGAIQGNDTGSQVYHWNDYGTDLMESTIVRSGVSMPFYYENDGYVDSKPAGGPNPDNPLYLYSEASVSTSDLAIGSNWTLGGAKSLVIWFYGDPNNDAGATEQMYVALEGGDSVTVVPYDGDMDDITKPHWQKWSIPLSEFTDVNLANVQRLYIGFGNRDDPQSGGAGIVYFDDIQLPLDSRCELAIDEVMASFDGNCAGPGEIITYTICYSYLGDANCCPDINDVNLIDELPDEVEPNNPFDPNYNPYDNTYTWHIGTLKPGDVNCVTLKVNVKECVVPGSTITNECKLIRDGNEVLVSAEENTPVCCPTLTKVDDVNDWDCVVPDANITYSICYAANGYGDTNVEITDELPPEVNFIWASDRGIHKYGIVTWDIGTLGPNDSNCITLIVKVNENAESLGTITNCCGMTGDCIDINDCEDTNVCWWPCCYPIYVDANATGANNGCSWLNAFTNLQDALVTVQYCDCNEIRVAAGTYKPDQGYTVTPGDREATFGLINNVAIYGGFPPGGGPWEVRDPNDPNNETILSGDLEGNDRLGVDPCDLLNDPCRADNSYHVVTGSGTDATAVLDGFTITAGNANGPWENVDDRGGGMYNSGGNPTITNCTFTGNSADYSGSGMCNSGSPNIINCTFDRNSAKWGAGGGMYNGGFGASSDPNIINCIFIENWAKYGGGMSSGGYEVLSAPNIINCIFIGNSAEYGGGMYNVGADANLINCTFSGNWADGLGGGIYSILSGTTITNCILWGNVGEQIGPNSDGVSVTYSDIQGGWPGIGNINDDPMLEPDGYHLTPCSPCIDAGDPNYIAGPNETDIDGEPRIIDGDFYGKAIVDMGADEYYIEDCNALLYAHCPRPPNDATVVLHSDEFKLEWTPGLYVDDVNGHKVYYSEDFNDVNDRTALIDTVNEPYLVITDYFGPLQLNTTYYWAVDEVNTTDLNEWTGEVWHFTTENYLVVDDMDSYGDNYTPGEPGGRIWYVWLDGWFTDVRAHGNYTGSQVYHWNDYGTDSMESSIFHSSPHSMPYYYENDGTTDSKPMPIDPPYPNPDNPYMRCYSEASAKTVGPNSLNFTEDWTVAGVKVLSLWFYGDPNNDANATEQMYVALEDGDNPSHIAVVPYDGNMTDIKEGQWHRWNIFLSSEFNDVNLTNVQKLYIGFGDRDNPQTGGMGIVYFDDIRLYQSVCILSERSADFAKADFTDDCVVNYQDLKIMTYEWLDTNSLKTDLYWDNIINFRDFAILAEHWLEEQFSVPE